jgi:hypothetical protein
MSTYSNISPGGIIATDNDKGGVGKSFTGLCLAHCLTSAGFTWVGIDGDRRNAHLHRSRSGGRAARTVANKPAAAPAQALAPSVMPADAASPRDDGMADHADLWSQPE